jgi:hypothetical protein
MVLGAVIGAPGFAASGIGVVLGGIAINLASSAMEPILSAPDDDQRTQALEQGLAQHDEDVTTLSAAVLAHAGPDMVQALPQSSREDLIAGLEKAMQEAGGPLAAIAPRYADALRSSVSDWTRLQADLKQTISSVRQTMVAERESRIGQSHQKAEGVSGPVQQTMRASDHSEISGSSQSVVGAGTSASARHCPTCSTLVADGQRFCSNCGTQVAAS